MRYAETDKMGVTYHAQYFVWFEVARTDLCRDLGFPYSLWEKEGIFLPVVEAHCRYKAPSYYDDEIGVMAEIVDLKPYSIRFAYQAVRLEDSTLIVEGWTKHAFCDQAGKLIRSEHKVYQWLKEAWNNVEKRRLDDQGSSEKMSR